MPGVRCDLMCQKGRPPPPSAGIDLADCVADFIDEYNTIQPHETLAWRRPLDTYLTDPTLKPKPPKSEQDS